MLAMMMTPVASLFPSPLPLASSHAGPDADFDCSFPLSSPPLLPLSLLSPHQDVLHLSCCTPQSRRDRKGQERAISLVHPTDALQIPSEACAHASPFVSLLLHAFLCRRLSPTHANRTVLCVSVRSHDRWSRFPFERKLHLSPSPSLAHPLSLVRWTIKTVPLTLVPSLHTVPLS